MENPDVELRQHTRRTPWNKGKLIGAKPPLRTKHVWSIRTKLQVEGRTRDLAMFNLAIDSKLRGCDVVGLKVEDIAPHGIAVDRATVRQRKTGRPVRFELTEQTREAVDDYIKIAGKVSGGVPIWRSAQPRAMHNDATVRATRVGMDRKYRIGPTFFWHAFAASDQSHAHLPPHRQSARCPTAIGTHQDREHGALPRY
jgi:integrase